MKRSLADAAWTGPSPNPIRSPLLSIAALLVGLALVSPACSGGGESTGEEPTARGQNVELVPEELDSNLGRYRALLIGIDDYEHWTPLRFAERDVRELRDLLVNQYGFHAEDVNLLLGANATESRIYNEVHSFLKDATEEDNLLIYYSGHGNLDPLTETGYWVPHDGELSDETTWVPFTSLRKLLVASKLAARSVVLITDSCYGGSLTRSGPTPGRETPEEWQPYVAGLMALIGKKSRQVVASGGFETVPDRSDFAAALRSALETNEYPLVDLEFLFFYRVYPSMRLAGTQKPLMERLATGIDSDGQFIFRRVRAAAQDRQESLFWASVSKLRSPDLVEEYLRRWPNGPHAEEARRMGAELAGGEPVGGGPDDETAFWARIQDQQDAGLFEEYLRRWPDGVFAAIARAELENLKVSPPTPDAQPASAEATVPRLLGEDQGTVRELLAAANLRLGVLKSADSSRPRGTVVEQRPRPGERVASDTPVDIVVSRGGMAVPSVEGMDLKSATRALEQAGLKSEVLRWEAKGKPGVVLEQVPRAGTFNKQGGSVFLTVAGVEVPAVAGLDLKAAEETLQKAGFRNVNRFVAGSPDGQVVSQEPMAGSVAEQGGTVNLVTARSDRRPDATEVAVSVLDPGVMARRPELTADRPPAKVFVVRLAVPELVSPSQGEVFKHYPRKTRLVWRGVSGAAAYGVEVEFMGKTWTSWIEKSLRTTSYEFNFVGAQPGRWRVWALDKDGRAGPKSEWREFRYLR